MPLVPETGGRYRPVPPYFQDDWKVLPNLTINLGVRYDSPTPFHEVHDNFSFFNPTGTHPATGNLGVLEYAGYRGADISCQCHTPIPTYLGNIGPRLGLEYSPDPNTVFRAGFAIVHSCGGGVGGRAGDSVGTGQTGFGSSIILPTANNVGANAGPSFYLNNGAAFQAAGIAIAQRAGPSVTVPYPGYAAAGAVSSNATIGRMLRPYPQYSAPPSATYDNIANLSYNAFEVVLAQREFKGVSFTLNYTYSHYIGDDGTTRSAFAIPASVLSNGQAIAGNNRADRSLVITDIPQNLNAYGVMKSPFGKALKKLAQE